MQVAFMAWLVSTGGCWIFYDHVLYNKEVRYQKVDSGAILVVDSCWGIGRGQEKGWKSNR